MRYWFGQRVGIDFTAGYYRHRLTPTLTASSTQVMPSVLVMFTEPDPSRDVDVRPYAGGGVNYARLLSGTPATGAGAPHLGALRRGRRLPSVRAHVFELTDGPT
jgi:hypothetical protein